MNMGKEDLFFFPRNWLLTHMLTLSGFVAARPICDSQSENGL